MTVFWFWDRHKLSTAKSSQHYSSQIKHNQYILKDTASERRIQGTFVWNRFKLLKTPFNQSWTSDICTLHGILFSQTQIWFWLCCVHPRKHPSEKNSSRLMEQYILSHHPFEIWLPEHSIPESHCSYLFCKHLIKSRAGIYDSMKVIQNEYQDSKLNMLHGEFLEQKHRRFYVIAY